MNIKKLYEALYNKGFRNTEAYEIIGKIAVKTNGFKTKKYSDTFGSGKRKVGINYSKSESGEASFDFIDIKESFIVSDKKLQIRED